MLSFVMSVSVGSPAVYVVGFCVLFVGVVFSVMGGVSFVGGIFSAAAGVSLFPFVFFCIFSQLLVVWVVVASILIISVIVVVDVVCVTVCDDLFVSNISTGVVHCHTRSIVVYNHERLFISAAHLGVQLN